LGEIRWLAGAIARHRDKKNKTGKVLRIVLDGFGEDNAAVVSGGAAAGDAGGGFVSAREDFANASSGVLCGDALEMRVRDKELLALCESHGM